jgi:hypothetical protein
MKKGLILVVVGIMASLFSGCASTGFLMAKPQVSIFNDTYPPKDENAAIDVFFTSKPTQEYIEFALISCRDTETDWNMNQILKAARRIGADAIILTNIADYWNNNAIGVIAVKYNNPTQIAGISF